METFKEKVRQTLGMSLTDGEYRRLYAKYQNQVKGRELNEASLSTDLSNTLKVVSNKKILQCDPVDENAKSFDDVVGLIASAIIKASNRIRGDNEVYKCFLLLSVSRSNVITRAQLKSACLYRLNLGLSDAQIDVIFQKYDRDASGMIKTKTLIDEIVARKDNGANSFIYEYGDKTKRNIKSTMASSLDFVNARVSYDAKFTNLHAPPDFMCPKMTVEELEKVIKDKVAERNKKSSNALLTLRTLFSDCVDKQGNAIIDRDQMRFTLWTRLQLPISDSLIEQFFRKHDHNNTGRISLHQIIEGMLQKGSENEPLLEDHPIVPHYHQHQTASKKQGTMMSFLQFLRKMISKLINREGRAPSYLLSNNSSRMSKSQAEALLERKLGVKVDSSFLDEVQASYPAGEYLLDLKRLFRDAMSLSQPGAGSSATPSSDSALLKSAIVVCDEMPATLKGKRIYPEFIESQFLTKINERMKNDMPMSSLHKLFQIAGQNTRIVSKLGMRKVLARYDILMNDEDYDAFFAKHDRGDGQLEVRTFLKALMPLDDFEKNGVMPKDPVAIKDQAQLTKAVGSIVSLAPRRMAQSLNGVAGTRFEGRFVSNVLEATGNVNGSSSSSEHDVSSFETTDERQQRNLDGLFSETTTLSKTLTDKGGLYAKAVKAHVLPPSNTSKAASLMRPMSAPASVHQKKQQQLDEDAHGTSNGSSNSPLVNHRQRNYFPSSTSSSFPAATFTNTSTPLEHDNGHTSINIVNGDYRVLGQSGNVSDRMTFVKAASNNESNNPARIKMQQKSLPFSPTTTVAAPTSLFYPSRPTTAPPSNRNLLSPRSTTTVRSPRENFVYTGQPRTKGSVEYQDRLIRKRINVAKKSLTTTNEEFGLFIKNLNRAKREQQSQDLKYEQMITSSIRRPRTAGSRL